MKLIFKHIILFLLLLISTNSSCYASIFDRKSKTELESDRNKKVRDRKVKTKKFKKHKRNKKPSPASVYRLKAQSKKARHSIQNTGKKNFKHKKNLRKRQKSQRKYSARKNHFVIKHKKVWRKKPKKIRRAKGLENVNE